MKDLKDVLLYIVQNITTHPDDVKITEKIENGVKNLTIETNPEDTGRIIGKEGKIIKAIRSVMRVAAIQRAERVRVSVLSDNNNEKQEISLNQQTENSLEDDSQAEDSIDLSI